MKPLEPLANGDTIAAVSTPHGIGGIGIVKVSGPHAEKIAHTLFRPRRPVTDFVSHRLYYGHIIDPHQQDAVVDEVLVVLMRAPHSYTREDVVEIQCHGGYMSVQRILDLVLAEGARLARPGEFTLRAFLNGRIDLTQAEAVLDVVEAKTRASSRLAQHHLSGLLSQEIHRIREVLFDLLVRIEAGLDFPEEEDVSEVPSSEIVVSLEKCIRDVEKLASTYREGHLLRDGVKMVIAGRPNVGKSTLMNALLGRDRVLVSPVPGTTRDFVEADMAIGGIPVTLIDTAGLRTPGEGIEAMGIEVAMDQIAKADIVLVLFDASAMVPSECEQLIELLPEKERIVVVINKIDLVDAAALELASPMVDSFPHVKVSALYRQGIDALKETVLKVLIRDGIDIDSRVLVTSARHVQEMHACCHALERARSRACEAECYFDLIAADLRDALSRLDEIVGTTTTQDVLDAIFSRFCIGK